METAITEAADVATKQVLADLDPWIQCEKVEHPTRCEAATVSDGIGGRAVYDLTGHTIYLHVATLW